MILFSVNKRLTEPLMSVHNILIFIYKIASCKLMNDIHIETPTLFVRRVHVYSEFNYQSIALKSQPFS
jgi:hypothetical protein